jgi:hypothetical protein
MFTRLIIAAVLSFAALPALAEVTDFYGKWKITESVKAPWEDPANPMTTDDPAQYTGKVVEIGKDSMTGPDLIGCGATSLSVESFPFAGLFEGGLGVKPGDPTAPYDEAKAKRLAHGLGFTAEPVESLIHGCSELILHRLDDTTLVFGLDNRIFTMTKQ